jgi:hypothetical protein
VSIPAVEPPIAPGTPTSMPPGWKASRLTGMIDDSQGSGVVIPLNQVDDQYVDWRLQTFDGWDSADADENAENRTGADGAFDAQNYYGARLITVGGMFTAPTYEEREAAEYRLRQATPLRGRYVQLRIDETVPKYVTCRRSGRLKTTPLDDVHSKWETTLLCPDPLKYGLDPIAVDLSIASPAAGLAPPWTAPITFPARVGGTDMVTVTNTGLYDTQPITRIVGPGSGPQLWNLTTGLHLAYDLELGVTDYLLIDCHAGVALLNGTAPRGPISGSSVTERFVIQPGANQLQLRGTATDPLLVMTGTVQFNPAWD